MQADEAWPGRKQWRRVCTLLRFHEDDALPIYQEVHCVGDNFDVRWIRFRIEMEPL